MTRDRKGALLPPRQQKPGDLALSKRDVLERQLKVALRLWATGGDPVAAHVLASAARDILVGVGKGQGKSTMLDRLSERIDPKFRDEFITAFSYSFNFMKHGKKDADALLYFNPAETEMVLFWACMDYWMVFGDAVPEVIIFIIFATHKWPKMWLDAQPFEDVIALMRKVLTFDQLDRRATRDFYARFDEVMADPTFAAQLRQTPGFRILAPWPDLICKSV